jgi:hypothetical protein
MPPYRPTFGSSSSDNDSDAPESVPLDQSKTAAKEQSEALLKFETELKEKKRVKNREIDRRLKERASLRKEKERKEEEEEEVEMDEDDGDDERGEAHAGSGEDSDSDDKEDIPSNSDYLPDHLFASASATTSTPPKTKPGDSSAQRKRRKLTNPKELIVGYEFLPYSTRVLTTFQFNHRTNTIHVRPSNRSDASLCKDKQIP